MDAHTTIAKCCYCGQKVILERGQALSCSACGAPLREFKSLASLKKSDPKPKGFVPIPRTSSRSMQPLERYPPKIRKSKKTKNDYRKKRKSFLSRFGDIAEDIFDEVSDIFD